MKAVTAGNVIAVQAHGLAVFHERQVRTIALEVMCFDVRGVIDRHCTGRGARGHQVAGDFGLAVDHYRPAIGKTLQVDALAATGERQLETVMDHALCVHAFTDARFTQQVGHTLFQNACADARKDVIGVLALDDDVVDAGTLQQLAQQQPGRA